MDPRYRYVLYCRRHLQWHSQDLCVYANKFQTVTLEPLVYEAIDQLGEKSYLYRFPQNIPIYKSPQIGNWFKGIALNLFPCFEALSYVVYSRSVGKYKGYENREYHQGPKATKCRLE